MLEPLPATPFISVFGLTYNHEDFVASAIESVLAQGWPADRFEYVLLDDGSTDATPDRVRPYRDRITYVRQDNQGINPSVSRVVSLLRGDLIVSCGGDDEWPAGKLERTVEYLREHPEVGMVYGDMAQIDSRSRVTARSILQASGITDPPTGQVAGRLLAGNFINGGTMAFRGAFKDDLVPLPPETAWEDWWFAWVLSNLAPVGFLDAVTYHYRLHSRNLIFGVSDHERQLDHRALEVPFRRYLLGNARPGKATPADLLAGADMLVRRLQALEAGGRDVDALLTVGEAQRAASARFVEQGQRLERAQPVLAAFAAARALAADPRSPSAYRLLHGLAGTPNLSPPPVEDWGRVAVFADLEELVAEPSLLAGYVEAFAGVDGVTLVAAARTWDAGRLARELSPLESMLARDDAPDVVALPAGEGAYLNALTRADAALTVREPPVPGIRRFTDPRALRAYADRRLRFPLMR